MVKNIAGMKTIQIDSETYVKSITEAELRIHVSGTSQEVIVTRQAEIEQEASKSYHRLVRAGGYIGRLLAYKFCLLSYLTLTHNLPLTVAKGADSLTKERYSNEVVSAIYGERLKLETDKEKQIRGIDGYLDGKTVQIKFDYEFSKTGNLFYELGTRPHNSEAEIEYRKHRW